MKKQLLLGALLGCTSVGISFAAVDIWNAVRQADVAAVQQYIDEDGDVNIRGEYGNTPLYVTVKEIWGTNINYFKVVRLLIKNGANVNAKGQYGMTPLYMVIDKNYLAFVRFFIENGADVNAKNYRGNTPLHFAVEGFGFGMPRTSKLSYVDVASLLIEKGAKVDIKNEDGETPFSRARTDDMRNLFKEHQKKLDLQLFKAIAENNLDRVKQALKSGAKINAKYEKGWTPLHIAVRHNYPEIVKFLLGYGADPTIKDDKDETPVDIATSDYELLRVFVEAGYKK